MGKGKKKHLDKETVSEDLLDAAALSVRKFRKVTKEIGKLSLGQKLLGGAALVAAGLLYLAVQDADEDEAPGAARAAEPPQLSEAKGGDAGGATEETAGSKALSADGKAGKSSKPGKARGSTARKSDGGAA